LELSPNMFLLAGGSEELLERHGPILPVYVYDEARGAGQSASPSDDLQKAAQTAAERSRTAALFLLAERRRRCTAVRTRGSRQRRLDTRTARFGEVEKTDRDVHIHRCAQTLGSHRTRPRARPGAHSEIPDRSNR
jgi:hypothetical protein